MAKQKKKKKEKEPDNIGPLGWREATAQYEQRFGLPPMQDPPAVWANMASWMADDARTTVAYLAWFDNIDPPPPRFVQKPHEPPSGGKRLTIERVPRSLEVVYERRRKGIPFQIDERYGELVDLVEQLRAHKKLLEEHDLVPPRNREPAPRKRRKPGRMAEWGLDAFAFTFPFLWARHGDRVPITNEIIALTARALKIGRLDDLKPIDSWRRRVRRLGEVDPSSTQAGPEVVLIRMIQKEYGHRWETALHDFLHQRIEKADPERGNPPGGQ